MSLIAQVFVTFPSLGCLVRHPKSSLVWVRNIYGDEIVHSGYKRSIWKCKVCGTTVLSDVQVEETKKKQPRDWDYL